MLTPGLKLRGHNVERVIFSVHGAIPNATAESCNVDFFRVLRIRNDPMPPFEVEARYARPVLTPVLGSPSGGLKSRSIQNVWVARINRHIINVAVAIEHLPPSFACILRQVDAAAIPVFSFIPCPCRKIETIRCVGIDCQAIRTIACLGHCYTRPAFCPVAGFVDRTITLGPDTPVFGTSRYENVKRAPSVSHDSPGKWFFFRNACIFQRPVLPYVHCANDLSVVIKWVKMVAVGVRDIEPGASPTTFP